MVIAATAAPRAFAGGTVEIGEHHSVTFGAGPRSAFTHIEGQDDFAIQNLRLYVGGQIHEKVKVLYWASQGKTAWETARILDITQRTVTAHISAATAKMGCVNKVQLLARVADLLARDRSLRRFTVSD